MNRTRIVPGYYRQKFHTLDDLVIFHESSELVQRAGLMPQQDTDMDRMRMCERFVNNEATCAVERHAFLAFGIDTRP